MGCGSCGADKKTEKYGCSVHKDACPTKEVKKGDSVPECCGAPMIKKNKN